MRFPLARKQMVLIGTVGLFIGCTHEKVVVLNNQTGQPVAGATVVPFVNDIFGSPGAAGSELTDADGKTTITRIGTLHALEARTASMHEVSSGDRPTSLNGARVLYLAD
jgi:hypothetical protein